MMENRTRARDAGESARRRPKALDGAEVDQFEAGSSTRRVEPSAAHDVPLAPKHRSK